MPEKVTCMVLKVDLQCPCCFKKIKKLLCKFPQIRDQVFDEQKNLVKITVVCCSPEKIRDKLCCKGGNVIHSIEIVEPQRPKDPGKPVKPPPENPKESPPPLEKIKHKEPVIKPTGSEGFCRPQCYDGYAGPCYHGYGPPPPPLPCPHCYDNYYGCRYGYNRGCHISHCYYFSQENTSGCTIM